jgi:CheY-like chemotaxis protein
MPRKPLILCADDEWNGLEGHKMLFEEAGCKVLVATSGTQAIRLTSRRFGASRLPHAGNE